MAHINSWFPSNYVAAADLQGRDVTVTIAAIKLEKVGTDQEERPVLYFQGMTKGMVMNRTNGKRISKLYGPETNEWVGKPIILYESETDFGGETVPCIRVREHYPQAFAQMQMVASQPAAGPSPAGYQHHVMHASPVTGMPLTSVAAQPGAVAQNPTQPAVAGPVTF